MSLIIENALVFTNDDKDQVLRDQSIVIENNLISEITGKKINDSQCKKIDAQGRLVMPGLTNAHMHFYGTYARGIDIGAAPANFLEILQKLWWKLDSVLDMEAVYFSTLVPAITAVKKGITSIIDHHASPHAIDGSLDMIEKALMQLGIRAVLCYEVSDRDGKEIRDQGLAENERYIKKCRQEKSKFSDYLFDGMVGLHASFTLDDDTLAQAGKIAKELERGCHIHMLEGTADRLETKKKYGSDVVERLEKCGILGAKTIVAHAIDLDNRGREILATTDTIVAHNPQSNMNNAVGRTDIFSLLDKGILLGYGTDGMSPDVKPDVRTGYLLHKHALSDNNLGWMENSRMLLKNNPAIYRRVSGQKIGQITPGFQADIIIVDYYPPTVLTAENFWGHFLFGIIDTEVDTTIINGKVIMENKIIEGIDEQKIAAESTICSQKIWKKFQESK